MKGLEPPKSNGVPRLGTLQRTFSSIFTLLFALSSGGWLFAGHWGQIEGSLLWWGASGTACFMDKIWLLSVDVVNINPLEGVETITSGAGFCPLVQPPNKSGTCNLSIWIQHSCLSHKQRFARGDLIFRLCRSVILLFQKSTTSATLLYIYWKPPMDFAAAADPFACQAWFLQWWVATLELSWVFPVCFGWHFRNVTKKVDV